MNLLCRFAVITIFLVGLVTVGILGTSATMTFVWPAYLMLGLSGMASVIVIFRQTKYAIPFWCIITAFGFSGFLLLRAMNSPVAHFAREDGALLISCFIAYAVFLSMLDDSRWRRGLFWCIVALLGLNCAMAAIQLIFGAETWFLSGYERTFSNRIGGLFNHPEHFAGFLALGIPLVLSTIIFGRHSKLTVISLSTLCGLCLLGIVLSKSLLALLALIVGLAVLGTTVLILCWKNLVFNTQKSITLAAGILILVLGTFVGLNSTRVGNLIDQKIMTRDGQISLPGIWGSSLEQFSENPLAGTGSRTFYYFSRKYRPEQEGSAHFETEFVHNEYLQLLADYGLIGLLLALAFVSLHFYNGYKFVLGYKDFQPVEGAVLPKSDHLGMVAGSVAAIATIAFLAFFDFVMHVPAIALTATVLVGVLACPDPMSRALRPEEENTYVPGGGCLFVGRGLAFGCGIALTLFSCIFSRSEWHLEMARHAYESGNVDAAQLKHLEIARKIDPENHHVMTLSAHSYVQAIKPDMAPLERYSYLEKAEGFFSQAEFLYPQDIENAIAHSVVLDELGRTSEAEDRIRIARQWAPYHGNLLIAQAEHFLLNAQLDRAEKSYALAQEVKNFPNPEAIEKGLAALATKRLEMGGTNRSKIANSDSQVIKEGKVLEVEFSGDINQALESSIKMLEEKIQGEIIDFKPITFE